MGNDSSSCDEMGPPRCSSRGRDNGGSSSTLCESLCELPACELKDKIEFGGGGTFVNPWKGREIS